MDEAFSSVVAKTSSNVNRLSTTVSHATQSLASGVYGDLVAPRDYHRTMHEITAPLFQKRLFTFKQGKGPVDLMKRTVLTDQTRIQVMASLPDELLVNIPPPQSKYSLFQGFEARVYEELSTESTVAPDIKEQAIEACEIRKEIATTEIQDLDRKINALRQARKAVFDQIANVEKRSRQLDRLLVIGEDDDDEFSGSDQEDSTHHDEQALDESSGEFEGNVSGVASADISVENASIDYQGDNHSIYDQSALQSSNASIRSRSASSHRRRLSRRSLSRSRARSSKPTLQSFYESGEQIKSFKGAAPISCLDFDEPFGMMVAGTGSQVDIWDLSGDRIISLEGHIAPVRCIQIAGPWCFSGSQDSTVRIWDVSNVSRKSGWGGNTDSDPRSSPASSAAVFAGHQDVITTLDSDGFSLTTGSNDQTVRTWDIETGKCLDTLDVVFASRARTDWQHSQQATSLARLLTPLAWPVSDLPPVVGALQRFDAALATGTADGIVRLWDLRSDTVMRTFDGHLAPITCLKFDETHLVTGSLDKTVRVWDLRTGKLVDVWSNEGPVLSLSFDRKAIFVATGESGIHAYDRIKQTHSLIGQKEETDANEVKTEHADAITCLKQQKGYLVAGRLSGEVGVWAV